ncbi:hypothetical protein V5799_000466, partial [Amblyomma americanum]
MGRTMCITVRADGEREELLSNLSRVTFDKRAECFVHQYGNISATRIPGIGSLKINGTQTLSENIADNVGLRAAFSAYIKLLAEDCENTDTRLEGLEYLSGEQLFFISRAMESCRVFNVYGALMVLLGGTHSPPRY